MAELTLEQQKRVKRRQDILTRINGSGQITDPVEAAKLAKDIETFEFEAGTTQYTVPLLASGATSMTDILKAAQASMDALSSFD